MRRWLAASLLVFALAAAPGLCDAAVTTSAEAVYWRPTGFDLPVTIPVNAPGVGDRPGGHTRGIEHGFTPGYRVGVDIGRVRARWLDLASTSQHSDRCPDSQCLPAQIGPLGTNGGIEVASASSFLRVQAMDLEFRQPFGSDPTEPAFGVMLGLRYARIVETTDLEYASIVANPGANRIRTRVVNNMFGLRTGLDGAFPVGGDFSVSGSCALSLLSGRTHQDDSEVSTFGGTRPTSQAGTARNDLVYAFELGARVDWRTTEALTIRAGFELLQFIDGLIVQKYSNPGNIVLQEDRRSVGFLGPALGASWRFSSGSRKRRSTRRR